MIKTAKLCYLQLATCRNTVWTPRRRAPCVPELSVLVILGENLGGQMSGQERVFNLLVSSACRVALFVANKHGKLGGGSVPRTPGGVVAQSHRWSHRGACRSSHIPPSSHSEVFFLVQNVSNCLSLSPSLGRPCKQGQERDLLRRLSSSHLTFSRKPRPRRWAALCVVLQRL